MEKVSVIYCSNRDRVFQQPLENNESMLSHIVKYVMNSVTHVTVPRKRKMFGESKSENSTLTHVILYISMRH